MIHNNNISTIFLLPAIEIPELIKEYFLDNGFINTFVTSKRIKYPFEVMFLLFNPKRFNEEYNRFERMLIYNPNYLEVYDLGNKHVLYVFKIPEKFKSDYYTFLNGKYSKFSEEYKRLFPEKSYLLDVDGKIVRDLKGKPILQQSPFYHVFTKSDYLKAQLADKLGYDENDEIFNDLELFDIQYPEKEEIKINLEI